MAIRTTSPRNNRFQLLCRHIVDLPLYYYFFSSVLVTMPGVRQSELQNHPLAPVAALALANECRGLYEDLVCQLQDPRPDLVLPRLDPKYYTESLVRLAALSAPRFGKEPV